MIASTHLSPWATVPPALLLAAVMVFYWSRVGRTIASSSRRRVRRWSLVFGLLALPSLVRGLSFLDPERDPIDYVVTWSVAMVLVLVLFLVAFLDVMMTIRAHGRKYEDEMKEAGRNLARALEKRGDEGPDAAPPRGAGATGDDSPPPSGHGGDR